MKNILITVSGGRSSAMMARHIQTSEKYKNYNKLYVFCNTGMERQETIDFLKNIENNWGIDLIKIEGVYSDEFGKGVDYKIVDWDTLDMNCDTFEKMIAHKNKGIFNGLPNQDAPYCSENLKTTPARKLANYIFGNNNYITSIGFRKEDMPKRISWAEIKEDKNKIFPLITDFQNPISQFDLNDWWKNQDFKLEIHGKYGNCELCWKKSKSNLIDNIKYGSKYSIEFWKKMEDKYKSTSFRGNISINDLVRLSKEPVTGNLFDEQSEEFKCICNF